MPRHVNTRCYSYAAALAAAGHPNPRKVLATAATMARAGTLPTRAAGVRAAMVASR